MMHPLIRDNVSGVMYRHWEASSPKAVFLLVHGLGAHTGRWEFFADFFSANGFASFALELQGFGQSNATHGYVKSLGCYYDDIIFIKNISAQRYPGKKIFLVGESMGGLITYLLVAMRPSICDGLICLSPAFGNKLSFRWADYAAIFYSYFFDPMRTFRMPFDSRMCTRDTEYQKIMDETSDETRIVTGRLLGAIALAQLKAVLIKKRIIPPVLFLTAGNDSIVDTTVSEKVFKNLNASDKKMINYPGMYHALSIDLDRGRIFADMLDWVKKRI